MKNPWRYVALGVAAYLLFAIFTIPATLVARLIARPDMQLIAPSGTLWHGKAAALRVGPASLGSPEWQLRVLPLFIGRASADVKLKRDDGTVQTRVVVRPSKRVTFTNMSGALPLASLGAAQLFGGWQGNLRMQFEVLDLQNGWPTDARGTIDIANLTGPASQPVNLGAYRVKFAGASTEQGTLLGNVEDVEGLLAVTGTIKFTGQRSYEINAAVATRPNAPASLAQALQYLGPADAQGRKQLSVSGTI